ncbi:MAG: repeat-containing protein [Acidimicrobiales bacterium]|nr:repeat-containing protein [Acidimicrobiales bacterium]
MSHAPTSYAPTPTRARRRRPRGRRTLLPALFVLASLLAAMLAVAVGPMAPAGANVAPADAVDDAFSTPYETPLRLTGPAGLAANDTGDALTYQLYAPPSLGTAVVQPDGALQYTPPSGFSGAVSFLYRVTDSGSVTDTATVTITVGLPSPPDAVDDVYSVPRGDTLSVADFGGVLRNDQPATGLTVASWTVPVHGTVSVQPGGGFTYTPESPTFAGDDAFTVTVRNAAGLLDTSTVTIHVTAPAGHAVDDAYSVASDQGFTPTAATRLLANDTGLGIRVIANTAPGHGSVTTAANGAFTYRPNGGYSGPDSFTYTITDLTSQTSTATVRLDVIPAPVAQDELYGVSTNTPLSVSAPGVLDNDLGSALRVTGFGRPDRGTVTTSAPDGRFVYTPLTGYRGPDRFSYTVTDRFGRTATAHVNLAVSPAPVAAHDTYTADFQTPLVVAAPGLRANDTGSFFTVTSRTDPGHGTLTPVAADGSFTYTPAGGFAGLDTFSYTITDSRDRTSTATVTIRVRPECPTHCISGRLLDRTDGSGVEGLRVKVLLDGVVVEQALTGPNGRYTITGLDVDERYELKFDDPARIDAYAARIHDVAGVAALVPPGALLLVDRVAPYGSITGHVSDVGSGAAVGAVRVRAYDSAGLLVRSVTTAADGRFELPQLVNQGTYRIQMVDLRTPALYRSTFYDLSPGVSTAKPVHVDADIVIRARHR